MYVSIQVHNVVEQAVKENIRNTSLEDIMMMMMAANYHDQIFIQISMSTGFPRYREHGDSDLEVGAALDD